jgi:hypothetical protein
MRIVAVAPASALGCEGVMVNVCQRVLAVNFAAHISQFLGIIGPTPPPSPASARVSEAFSNKHHERGLPDTGKRLHESMIVSNAIDDLSETEAKPLSKR